MSLGDNTLSPLQIPDARDAAHRASELQREVEDELRKRSRELAECERKYREALALKILELRNGEDSVAWSTAPDVARGDKTVAKLRYERDVAEGMLEATKQQAFRRGADRRDIDSLIAWSQMRDLRTDAPPAEYPRPIGAAA